MGYLTLTACPDPDDTGRSTGLTRLVTRLSRPTERPAPSRALSDVEQAAHCERTADWLSGFAGQPGVDALITQHRAHAAQLRSRAGQRPARASR